MPAQSIRLLQLSCQYPLQELLRPWLFGLAEELLGRGVFDDDAAVHKQDTAGNVAREAHFVRDDQHGHSCGCQVIFVDDSVPEGTVIH